MNNPLMPYATALLLGKQREARYRRRQRRSGGTVQLFVQKEDPASMLAHSALQLLLAQSVGTIKLQTHICVNPPVIKDQSTSLRTAWQEASNQRWRDLWEIPYDPKATYSFGNSAGTASENLHQLVRFGGGDFPSIVFGGELFRGLERLPLLNQRLVDAGCNVPLLYQLPPLGAPTCPLPLFFSFRSPYSYLAVARLHRAGLLQHFEPRPVPPMVTRGVTLQRWKKMYIVWDVSRLARSLQIPFGHIADPLGEPARRCMRVTSWLNDTDRAKAWKFALAALQAIWGEGLYLGNNRNFNTLSQRVNLDWKDVRYEFERPSHDIKLNQNAAALLQAGHWGVPTTVLDGLPYWGQDQLGFVSAGFRNQESAAVTTAE